MVKSAAAAGVYAVLLLAGHDIAAFSATTKKVALITGRYLEVGTRATRCLCLGKGGLVIFT